MLPMPRPGAESAQTTSDHADGPMLFVVDDDLPTLELLCEIARDAGWVAHGFTHLSGLRASLEAAKPALVILDDDLPDGRGGDLARQLRHDERMAGTPILVCTAAHPMRVAEIGAWAPVISKPFDIDEIESFLAAADHRQQGADPYGQQAG
jgi:DNA-binding response OmpR family regulator